MVHLRFVNFTVYKIYLKIGNYKQILNSITNILVEALGGNNTDVYSLVRNTSNCKRDWWTDKRRNR